MSNTAHRKPFKSYSVLWSQIDRCANDQSLAVYTLIPQSSNSYYNSNARTGYMGAAQCGAAIKLPSGRGSAVSRGLSQITFDSLTHVSRAHIQIFTWLECDASSAQKIYTAIYHIQNTPTEPSRLQVTPSQSLMAPQVLVSRGPLHLWSIHWTFTGVPWIFLLFFYDDS
jgi:hypothetical protein